MSESVPKALEAGLRAVLPLTAGVDAAGRLSIGGCDAGALAREHGTPLYVFDEADIRARCREFRSAFQALWPSTKVVYAAKAYLGRAVARLVAEEGLWLDVVSGGELGIAKSAGFPTERVYFHGNNKLPSEVEEGVDAGVGTFVIDNFADIGRISSAAQAAGRRQRVLLRVTPDVDPHTHAKITTGVLDSKFGLPLAAGQAAEGVRQILARSSLDLAGLHCHIGSQVFEAGAYGEALGKVLEFAAAMRRATGLVFSEINVGGGMGLQYLRDEPPPAVDEYAATITTALRAGCARYDLPPPALAVEPGRAIIGRAGVALYTAGARKEVPGVRTFVPVDGGMADNIRPAMYGARYEALSAERPAAPAEEKVTIVGRYCESGDVLVRDAAMPRLREGEIIAIPASGAYCLAMASSYNAAPRPAVVFVRDGRSRLVRRRETYADLQACETDEAS